MRIMDDTVLNPLILNWLLELRGYIGGVEGGGGDFSPLNGIYWKALPDRYMSFYTSAK